MSIHYDWNYFEKAYTAMYEETKNMENTTANLYADHALGMLKLIPLIRNIPEFSKLSLDASMGRLMLKSSQPKIKIILSSAKSGNDFVYYAEIYHSQSYSSEPKKFSLEEIVPALQQVLKAITKDKS
jgi:hypothetical protein